MARVCCVSLAGTGHCDFGGMQFLHTAQELARRGHDVCWVFSHHVYPVPLEWATALVRRFGVPLDERHRFYLSVYSHHHSEDVRSNVLAFGEYLEAERYDCVVTDRTCIGAAFAAHHAKIPWAAVGTDGRAWSERLYRSRHWAMLPGTGRIPAVSAIAAATLRDGFPRPAVRSRWATSPFLNISFLPRRFHEDSSSAALPEHSHFVGGGAGSEPLLDRKRLLITFGNTFHVPFKSKLLEGLRPLILERQIPTTVLAGGEAPAQKYRACLKGVPSATVEPWVPYEQAFGEARVVVGHGGVGYLWHGLLAGAPLLAIPFIDDQTFGGVQIERMGIGAAVFPRGIPWLAPAWARWNTRLGSLGRRGRGPGYRLDSRDLRRKITYVLDDDAVMSRSLACSKALRRGGGAGSAAALLEKLAAEPRPVSACVTPACCC